MTDDDDDAVSQGQNVDQVRGEVEFRHRAAEIYAQYAGPLKRRFRWLPPDRFQPQLVKDLRTDSASLLAVLHRCGAWNAARDAKLTALTRLITRTHQGEKIIVFSQFADTVRYLAAQLQAHWVNRLVGVTGTSENPTQIAWRFSPVSNDKRAQVAPDQELEVLIATDVLSEGQNLQDGGVVVNYDLP